MWSPADLFTHGVDTFLAPAKKGLTFLYEHPAVLVGMLASIAILLFVVETVKTRLENRRSKG